MVHYLMDTERNERIMKIGNNMYWAILRRAEALKVMKEPNLDTGYSLKLAVENPKIIWRFPYPDEDQDLSGSIYDERINWEKLYERIPRKDSFLANPNWIKDWSGHRDIVIPISALSLGHAIKNDQTNVNFIIDCPLKEGFKIDNSQKSKDEEMPSYITIMGEQYVDGEPKTMFQCGWCGAPFTEAKDKISEYRSYLIDYAKRSKEDKWIEIANRIN